MGLSTVTNVRDVEGFITQAEKMNKYSFLTAYDIPASEAQAALNSLKLMGISEKTLFPGLDGVCRDYKDRMFDPDYAG